MIEIVRHTQRNVKRWQDGDMRKRWTAAGMLAAEQQFRRIIGYRDLAKLVIAIERHATAINPNNPRRQEKTELVTVNCQSRIAAKFYDDLDILTTAGATATASACCHGIEPVCLTGLKPSSKSTEP